MALDADNTRIAAGKLQRIALDQRVILFPDPAAGTLVGRSDKFQQCLGNIHFRNVSCGERGLLLRLGPRPVIFRRFIAQFLDRQIGDFLLPMDDAEAQIVGGLAPLVGEPYYRRGLDYMEADFKDKLRLLRVHSRHLRKWLIAWSRFSFSSKR